MVRSDLVLTHHPEADFARAFLIHDRATNRYWRVGPMQYEMARLFSRLEWPAACVALREQFEQPIDDSEIDTAYAELTALGLVELTQEAVDQARLSARSYRRALGRLGLHARSGESLHADVRAYLDAIEDNASAPAHLLETARALAPAEPRLMAALHLALHEQRVSQEERETPALLRWMRLQMPLFNPDRQLDRWLPHLRFFFQPWCVLLLSCAALSGFVIYLERAKEIHQRLGLIAGNLPLLFFCTVILLLVHEYAHALACKHFGGGVREMGIIVFLFFLPAAYCDVSDAHLFKARRAKLWVTFAGIWSTFVLASLGAWMWSRTVPTSLVNHTGLVLMVSGYGTVLTNLNPLLPLDGYFALCDWLGIDNLRDRATDFCKADLIARITGRTLPAATPRERRIFFVYFVFGSLYQIFYLLVSLAVGWLIMVRGGSVFGLLLYVALLYLLYLRNYWLRVQTLWRESRTKQLFAWLGAAAVLVLVLVFWRIPLTLSLPAVVHETHEGYVLEGEVPQRFVEVLRSPAVVRATVRDRATLTLANVSMRMRSQEGKTAVFAHAEIDPSVDPEQLADGLSARITVTSIIKTTLWHRLWGAEWDHVILDVWRLL
jgi:hypothetical protein